MNKKYVPFIVVFALFLLLPFTVQTVVDLRGEKRFVSLDIYKDLFCTPFRRESSLNENAEKLKNAWVATREDVAAGKELSEALEGTFAALSDLEASALTVNAYAELDSGEVDYKMLKQADTLLAALEDEPETFSQVDSVLKRITDHFGKRSMKRIFESVKHYGIWKGKYLRAFENKVEDENAMVMALRPQYQLAVWKIFSDPGEKVVLGSSMRPLNTTSSDSLLSEKWLFYRQDVEFLVQPSPLDVRSAKLDNPIKSITRFRDQLKKKGVELLVVVIPGKPSIYPERLTGKDPLVGLSSEAQKSYVPTFGHGKKILDSLTALGFNTVNLYNSLWNAKSEDEKLGGLYLNNDTHWTPRGAELAADEIAAKVRSLMDAGVVDIDEDEVEYKTADSVADRVGDIGEMSGLNKFNTFKIQQVTGHVVSPFKDDFRKSKIVILGDSFSRIYQTDAPMNAGWIAHFAKNMKQPVASIVSDGGASTLVREKLARKAGVLKGKKLLIWEFVERDLRFGAEGWKDVDF